MAQRNSNEPPGNLESVEPVDALKPVRSSDVDKVRASDTYEAVQSSDLMEPLESVDVIGLDYDEDIPTRVDGKRRQARQDSIFPPAGTDVDNVYYLADEVRPSPTVEAIHTRREQCTIPDGPKVKPPAGRETILPVDPEPSKVSSIAPVEMFLTETCDDAGSAVPGRRRRGAYGGAVTLLAAAAVAIAMWPTNKASAPVVSPPSAAANVAQTVETGPVAELSDPMTLDEVLIVARAPRVLAGKSKEVIAVPHSSPDEVMLEDAEQAAGKVGLAGRPVTEDQRAPLDKSSGRRQR